VCLVRYGSNHTISEFDLYFQDVQKRIKDQQWPNADYSAAQKIDITLVVDMLLTGFDSKYLNTLYVDKNLKHHGLIQATIPTTTPPLHETTPATRPTLAQLVAECRRPKKPKISQLDAHRAELLKIRKTGAPLRAIREGLAKMGVVVSEEALRLWFNVQWRRTRAKQPKARPAIPAAMDADTAPAKTMLALVTSPVALAQPAAATAPGSTVESSRSAPSAIVSPAITAASPASAASVPESKPWKSNFPPLPPSELRRNPRIARDDL